eukprot:992603_1
MNIRWPSLKSAVYVLTSICFVLTVCSAVATFYQIFFDSNVVDFSVGESICFSAMYFGGIPAGIVGVVGLYLGIRKLVMCQMILNTVAAIGCIVWAKINVESGWIFA